MNAGLVILSSLVIVVGALVYQLRKDFLTFTFLILFLILYLVVPFYTIIIEHQNSSLAYLSIELGAVFITVFYITYRLSHLGRTVNSVDVFYRDYPALSLLYKHAYLPLFVGIILKLIGGDLVHASIFAIPWKVPLVYGIADRIYYLGVMISFLSLYREGFNRQTAFSVVVILFFGLLSGSRSYVLLPLSFLILLRCSKGNFVTLIKMGILGGIALFAVIFLVGTYRIDAIDRSFDFEIMHDLILYRLSEFYWPMSLIEKIEDGAVSPNSTWIFTGMFGSVPAIFSELIMGISVFGRDTLLMREVGLGQFYQSVPLTPIGEGYYWFGIYGVVLLSVIFALGFVYLYVVGKFLTNITLLLLLLQLYRSVFALPSAAYPEFISLITKDLVFDYAIVILYCKFLTSFSRRTLRPFPEPIKFN
jgi:hypothetical protein